MRKHNVKLLIFPIIILFSCFSVLAQEEPANEATAETKPALKVYTAKEAKAEVIKALREKVIGAFDIGKYYEMIDKGKIAEAMKKINDLRPDPNAVLGAAGFYPSQKNPFGWRGDGNGRYTAAEPPLSWGRNSKAVMELKAQGLKPKAGETGKAIPEGVIREWLVLGPVPGSKLAGKEAGLEPVEGQKVDNLEWKAITVDTSYVNFWQIYGKTAGDPKNMVAYAHAWIYSSGGRSVYLQTMFSAAAKIWLNGKELGSYGKDGSRRILDLESGWNRLLLRVAPLMDLMWSKGVIQWYFNAAFFGLNPLEYEAKNIMWVTPMPDYGPGVSSPIIVGDKIFTQAELGVLIALKKKDGRVLWARSSTYADAATDAEKKKSPQVFSEINGLNAKIKNALDAYCSSPDKYGALRQESADNQRKINRMMEKLDPEKYEGQSGSEAGEAAPTPISDGEFVYTVYGNGVVACFDLNGNRKWTIAVGVKLSEHGYACSPALIDGKLIIKSSKFFGAVALDCKTGAVVMPMPVWKSKPRIMTTPLVLTVGNDNLVVESFGVVVRLKDGKILAQGFTQYIVDNVSPVVEGKTICSRITESTRGGVKFAFQTVPASITDPLKMKDVKLCEYNVKEFPCWFSFDHLASPLLYQGLAYVLSTDGVLTVIDSAKGEVVYQKHLDVAPYMVHGGVIRGGCGSSPTLAGKYIYIWDNQGATVVIEPGRTFKQVARNRIEQLRSSSDRNECMLSNPVFSGKQIFVRTEANLYCIGETAKK